MRNPGRLLLVAGLLGIAACSKPQIEGVDSLYLNGAIYTLNGKMPWAEAVAVTDGEIVYVGTGVGAEALVGENTRRHDLAGRMMLPGFIDSHMHPIMGGGYAQALSLDTFGTVDDWVAAIGDYAQDNPDAEVLFGYGFLATTFGPEGPTRQLIDAIESERPVLIVDEGFHAAWANSKTLDVLGVTQDTQDPVPGFSYYKRDANGDATGYLLEGTATAAMESLDVINEQTLVEGTAIVFDIMNSYGITAAFDAGIFNAAELAPRVLDRIVADGEMTVRYVGSHAVAEADQFKAALDDIIRIKAETHTEDYHFRVLKIMDDGTVEGRTAAMFEDYQGEPGNSGETVFTESQLAFMVLGAASQGTDVHIHALGERAIHEALNAIETARRHKPDTPSRFTICHIQVITDEDLPRFAELDVIAQSTPLWAAYDQYGKQFVSDDQFNRFWRYMSLKESGARLTFGSDFPASGAGTLGISPLFNIQIGHTRQAPGEEDKYPIQPRESERLDIDTLIRGYTINGAWQLRMEDEIGSIEVGKKADLVVLDRNLFAVDSHDIHKVQVDMTIMNGDIVYARDQ
ncbi:MAG: amidohydrolase [Gammaproteobacteria bacterium]|nr:amidohydrolase [Gammaproteobacteria bacterium]